MCDGIAKQNLSRQRVHDFWYYQMRLQQTICTWGGLPRGRIFLSCHHIAVDNSYNYNAVAAANEGQSE
jgi:hypothetical protein